MDAAATRKDIGEGADRRKRSFMQLLIDQVSSDLAGTPSELLADLQSLLLQHSITACRRAAGAARAIQQWNVWILFVASEPLVGGLARDAKLASGLRDAVIK